MVDGRRGFEGVAKSVRYSVVFSLSLSLSLPLLVARWADGPNIRGAGAGFLLWFDLISCSDIGTWVYIYVHAHSGSVPVHPSVRSSFIYPFVHLAIHPPVPTSASCLHASISNMLVRNPLSKEGKERRVSMSLVTGVVMLGLRLDLSLDRGPLFPALVFFCLRGSG
jgi:hypothetical protein